MSGFLIGILFRWMFNSEFGVFNDMLMRTGITDTPVPWLANPDLALVSVILANIWYGVAFFAMMILAALQSVPDELHEAAALDGAGRLAHAVPGDHPDDSHHARADRAAARDLDLQLPRHHLRDDRRRARRTRPRSPPRG